MLSAFIDTTIPFVAPFAGAYRYTSPSTTPPLIVKLAWFAFAFELCTHTALFVPLIVPPVITNVFSFTEQFANCLNALYVDLIVPPLIVVVASPIPLFVNVSIAYAISVPP